ncbi:MAG: DUF4381 domain-containing protein [Pseudomonadales bacterium]
MQDDPLAQLRDIHLPADPGWWPPAPGWWLLAALLLISLTVIGRALLKRHRAGRPHREALAVIDAALAAHARGGMPAADCINTCNAVLKRLWVHVDGNPSVAALSGDAWLQYLDARAGTTAFMEGPGHVLGDERFAAAPPEVDPQLAALLRQLLKPTRSAGR